jgi:drug/metabolite transporter (DMT)-like permease
MKKFFLPALAFLIWSTWVIPVRLLGYNTYTLSFYLCFFATIIWYGVNLVLKKNFSLNKKELSKLIILSFLFVGNMITYLLSLKITHSSIAVITHYTAPIFVALIAPITLNERLTKVTILSLIIAFSGFIIIFYNKQAMLSLDRGALYGLASGLFYGLSVIIARKTLKTVESELLIFYQNLFSVLILSVFFNHIDFSFNIRMLVCLLLLAVVYSGIASFLYLYGLKNIGGISTSIIGYFEPLGTIFWGWLIFNEPLTTKITLGGFLILVSGFIVTRYDRIPY